MPDPYAPPAAGDPAADPQERRRFFSRNELRECVWKAAAALLLLHGLQTGVWAWSMSGVVTTTAVAVIAITLLSLGAAVWAYLRSRRYETLPDEDSLVDGGVVHHLQAVLFSVLGLYLLVDALPALAAQITWAVANRGLDGDLPLDLPSLFQLALRAVFGVVLFTGSRMLQRAWLRFRNYGK